MKNISLSIVTHNSYKVIFECISPLLADIHNKFVIWLIDNNSQDSTIAAIKYYAENDRNIKIIKNPINHGFGIAHNVAIHKTVSDYHIICNPDIIVNGRTIGLLAEYMDKHPDIGILCPKLVNSDGSLQPNNHLHPTILDLALRRVGSVWLKKWFKKRMDAYIMLDVGYETSCDVPFASGAFMFCRTAVLKQVGGFDERYFLYFEDADLCRKVHEVGYRTVYYPEASVIHQWERAAHKSWRMSWVMLVSAVKYFNKWGYRWC